MDAIRFQALILRECLESLTQLGCKAQPSPQPSPCKVHGRAFVFDGLKPFAGWPPAQCPPTRALPCDKLCGVPGGVARCREAEGCGKAEAGAVTLPTLAVRCRPDPGSQRAWLGGDRQAEPRTVERRPWQSSERSAAPGSAPQRQGLACRDRR